MCKDFHSDSTAFSPFSIANIRSFIAFRVFFNSRFYYPVFTILFLDFGLSVAQFSILNAVWAATIVLAEVPSGALADITGRKPLMVFAASLMVVEVAIICFIPTSNSTVVFTAFLINRILSGLAEAAASGADEAIAYDSLKEAGHPALWGKVLEHLMRFQAAGFIIAMTVGAAVYDPAVMTALFRLAGSGFFFSQELTMRFPLYLTLILSVLALISTFKMEERTFNGTDSDENHSLGIDAHGGSDMLQSSAVAPGLTRKIKNAFLMTFQAAGWILHTPFVLSVIISGMLFDGLIRMVITLSSQYYRLVHLPESIFGIIGAGVSMFGLVVPRIARKIAEQRKPSHGLWITSLLTFFGLWGMTFFRPYWGLIPALVTFSAMYFTGFLVSYHVNRLTPSEQRATVLSFKGLLYNISYGFLGVFYALLLKIRREHLMPEFTVLENQGAGISMKAQIENAVFMDSFTWFAMAFPVGLCLILIVCRLWLRERDLSE